MKLKTSYPNFISADKTFHRRFVIAMFVYLVGVLTGGKTYADCFSDPPPPRVYTVANAGTANSGPGTAVWISNSNATNGFNSYGTGGSSAPGQSGAFRDPPGKCITTWAYAYSDVPLYTGPVQAVAPYSSLVTLEVSPNRKSVDDKSDGGTNVPPCHCSGMPAWSISEPYISFWLHDEPLGYQPAAGPRVSFELSFKQREPVAGFNTNVFGVGKKWNFSWFSYLAQQFVGSASGGTYTITGTNNVVY